MERLDLRLVDYFVTVAQELHFGRAAARLHIAQPSLSQQVRRLEQQLGVTLLERSSRRVTLTPPGEALLREGARLLRQASRVIESTRAAGRERIAVGFYGSAASDLLPTVLRAFGEHHPDIDVVVRELLLGSVDDVRDGSVDLAFSRLLPGQAELEIEVLLREPRVVALPSGHRLGTRKAVAFAQLCDERFITNPIGGGVPDRWLAEQRRHGLPGRVAAEAGSIQEILTLVASGRGICLVPSSVAERYPRADLRYVPVRDADPAVVSLVWPPGGLRPAVLAFIETAREASGVPSAESRSKAEFTIDPRRASRRSAPR
jgi:DNA-binding transcriptional LysR family regulator